MAYTKSSSRKLSRQLVREWYVSIAAQQSGKSVSNLADVTLSDSRVGDKSHNWRYNVRHHLNAASALTAWRKTYSGGVGSGLVEWTDIRYINGKNVPVRQWESLVGHIVTVPVTGELPPFSSATDEAARAKCIKKATGAMRAFSGATETLELREALRMLRHPAKRLRLAVRDHIKSISKSARRIKDRKARRSFIRDSYLEWVFGWTPSISAVKEAGSALNRRLERYQGSHTRVSGQETLYDVSVSNAGDVGSGYLKYTYDREVHSTFSSRYYGEVRSVAKNPIYADMRLFGATWGDLVLAGWEIVPWSFVVDYFTNIGDVLDSWTLHNTDWAWLVNTRRRRYMVKTTNPRIRWSAITSLAGYEPAYGHRGYISCSPARWKSNEVVRSTPLGPPSIGFDWELPGFGQKWLNLAALARTHNRAKRSASF